MITILITAIFVASAISLFIGAALGGSGLAQLHREKLNLQLHLRQIIHEYHRNALTDNTIQQAQKALTQTDDET